LRVIVLALRRLLRVTSRGKGAVARILLAEIAGFDAPEKRVKPKAFVADHSGPFACPVRELKEPISPKSRPEGEVR
jgi:hypothetical protein